MTRVLAIQTNEGIVAASDGLVVNQRREVVSENEVKIFELSQYCTVMAAGWLPFDIGNTFEQVRRLNSAANRVNASETADFLMHQFARAEHEVDWLRSNSLMINIAGYDRKEDGTFLPILLSLFRRDNRWQSNVPIRHEVLVAGEGLEATSDYIVQEIDAGNGALTLERAKKIANSAIAKATQDNPGMVGGEMTRWVIVPGMGIIKS